MFFGWRRADMSTDSVVYFLVQGTFVALIVVPIIFKSVLNWEPTSAPFNGAI
jgi:hypothetical protein